MKIRKITNYLLKQYPLKQQEEWDESGFLNKANLDLDINKFFTCLDVTNKTVDEAIKQNVKLIVSHHPIFTGGEHRDLLPINQRLINKIKKAKITVLSLHTCFDNSDIGMNWLIAEKLQLKNIGWYKDQKFVVGNLSKQLTVKEIANKFKKIFGVSLLTTNAKDTDKYSKLAICAGSGLSVFATKYDELAKQKILLVTGDIKHHGWQDLDAYKIAALDVGHNLENCFSQFIANLINNEVGKINCLAITTAKKEHSI